MNRKDFGLWGVELSREDFSQALAVLGIIFGEYLDGYFVRGHMLLSEEPGSDLERLITDVIKENRPLGWILYKHHLRLYDYQNLITERYPARILAGIWKNIIRNYGELAGTPDYYPDNNLIRLYIKVYEVNGEELNRQDGLWVSSQLSKPEVRAASVFTGNYDKTLNAAWDYPLRIGLLDDPESLRLRSDIEKLKFYDRPLEGTHVEIVTLGSGRSDCDILLLPFGLRESASVLLENRAALRCGFVIVTGPVNESGRRISPLIECIETQTHSSGACLLPISPEEIKDYHLDTRQVWFKEFIRQLSHNCPLDVALCRSSRTDAVRSSPPLIFASQKLIEESRITRRIEQFSRQIAGEGLENLEVKLPVSVTDQIDFESRIEPRESYSLNDISEKLRNPAEKFNWSHESDMATTFSVLKNKVEEELQKVPPAPRKHRRIQAEIWEYSEGNTGRNPIENSRLLMETTYIVEVFIGGKSRHSFSASELFPDEELPPGKNEHELTVFFAEPNLTPEPQSATIILPREGDSDRCEFIFRVPETVRQISARIIIAYKNRVLQTALLEAPVDARGSEKTNPDKKIELLVESVISPALQDLTQRQWFDAAFVVNHDRSGDSRMTTIVEDDAEFVSLAGLAGRIKWFDDAITDVADNWEKFETLESPKTQDLLRNCALTGTALYKALMAGRNEGFLSAAQRIQIVTAKYGARLPLEFVYGRLAPEDNAPLCPNARAALLTGKCDGDSCPTGRDEKKVICPLGFWGLNRVIERHAFDADAVKAMPNADFALQSDPVGKRTSLHILTSAALAASANVDRVVTDSTQKIADELDAATGRQSKSIRSWQEWVDDINTRSPSLLVLLPHTLNDYATKQPTLEISTDQRLLFARIDKDYILGPNKDPRPVVLLMGCETAAPDIEYESFVFEFRSLGAALVVGTGSTILGRHAAIVTCEFIKAIADAGSKSMTFGDVMLAVRRRMLAEGIIMAMCLTAYGDTEWKV